MCGIAGLIDPSLSADILRASAEAMADALAHRGPDGRGIWCRADRGVALGHRRLAIVELSEAGAQPFLSADGRWALSYNGELYDAIAHRPALETDGHVFRGSSDTEILIELIARHGVVGALARVDGIFAFAAYDRAQDRLWLARDRMGVKPLFYAATERRLLFGSQLSALTACSGFRPEIDPGAVASLLRHGYVPAPGAIYRGVAKLAPGHVLAWRAGEPARSEPYWSLDGVIAAGRDDPFRGTPEEAADALETLLRGAVRRQLMSDVPLGAFLSGGIDSSAVTALMAEGGARPRTFAAGFPEDPRLDESPHAAAVARYLGTDHTTIPIGEREALDLVARLPAIFDEPLADPSGLPTHLLCAATRAAGITVALSGDGGDELFAGYDRYALARRFARRVEPVPRPLRSLGAAALGGLPRGAAAILARALPPPWGGPEGVDRLRKAAGQLPGSGFDLYRRLLTLNPAAEALACGRPALQSPMDAPGALPLLARMRRLDSLAYLPDDVLAKVDRASMAVGLEARVPLLDRTIVEFAWRLPDNILVRQGKSKWPLRAVLARHVPPALFERRKQGFAPPLAAWLRGPLRDYARDLLLSPQAGGGFLDRGRVRHMLDEHLAGTHNHAVGLWPLLSFEAWRLHQSA
ncbi:asparagine synthase (glutamine-hydrolyzing) [Methylobacterium soli]|uniref:asparagine synthase (glutamine-hydrolyzing) n=1 Tax=Methylobacterium soli TaxID=553447 RepID=A0A6L3T3W8_9HYPH|nr:asparagine synthase (glutamine-hydrolyzing) [Methylobacterium soli]KAB1081380.1 asparagine synthase (glutamine-hydrolyzing) [Methylobacterium soli]GJE46859.1 Asparagine synthetase [glutamine-hydrolyzing] 1 [Methylobacterium soli]